MESKTIKSLLIIFVGLLAIAVGFHYLDKSSREKKSIVTADFNLSDFTEKTVEKVRIKKGNDEKILIKENESWKINGDEASLDKVSGFFSGLSEIKIKEIASKNVNNHKKFGITKDDAYLLAFTQNGEESMFFIGNSGASSDLFYIKKKGSKNIYLVSGALRGLISQDISVWIKEKPEEKEEENNDPNKIKIQ